MRHFNSIQKASQTLLTPNKTTSYFNPHIYNSTCTCTKGTRRAVEIHKQPLAPLQVHHLKIQQPSKRVEDVSISKKITLLKKKLDELQAQQSHNEEKIKILSHIYHLEQVAAIPELTGKSRTQYDINLQTILDMYNSLYSQIEKSEKSIVPDSSLQKEIRKLYIEIDKKKKENKMAVNSTYLELS